MEVEHTLDSWGMPKQIFLSWQKDSVTMSFRGNGGVWYNLTDKMVREKTKMSFADWLKYYNHVRHFNPQKNI